MTIEEMAIAAKTDNDIMLTLWEAVQRLIFHWAHKYRQSTETRLYDADDLVQAGYLALADAVAGYADESGPFVPYLSLHIRRRFAEVAGRRGTKLRPEVYADSLDVPLADDNDTTKLDMLADPGDAYADCEHIIWTEQLRAVLGDALAGLPDADLLVRRYYRGDSITKIASEEGISSDAVYHRERKALNSIWRSKRCEQLRQFLEQSTNYRFHVGAARFAYTHTSAVEEIILHRERLESKWETMSG